MSSRNRACLSNRGRWIQQLVSQLRILPGILVTIWMVVGVTPITGFAGIIIDAEPATESAAEQPHRAILAAVQAFRNNDIRSLIISSVGVEEFDKLALEWTENRDQRLADITDKDRADFATQMMLFTADNAEDMIMAMLTPQLDILRERAAQFVPMIQGMGAMKIEQFAGVTEENSQRLNQVVEALGEWALNTDIASPDLARQAVGVATRAARDLDIATLDDLANLEFDQILEKSGMLTGSVSEILSIYGLSLDETLDSYAAETIAIDGTTATVKNTFTILGVPLEVDMEYVLVDDKWLSRDAMEQSQKIALLADTMADSASVNTEGTEESAETMQTELLPAEDAYLKYRDALESAENYADITPFWSTSITGMEALQTPEARQQELEVLRNYASEVQIIGYSAFSSDATLYTRGADAEGNSLQGQVHLVNEESGWKIDAIEWSMVAVEVSGPGTELYEAVLYTDVPMVQKLLDQGGDPNYRENNRGILAWAAQSGSLEIVEMLIAAGADLNATDNVGQTALMRAIELQLVPVAEVLISAGSNLELSDEYGQTAVEMAVVQGYPGIVKALMAAGANFNVVDANGNSMALSVVQSYNNSMHEIISLLGESGADMDHSNYGYTALYYAVEQGDADLTRTLLEAGANPDARTDSDGVPLISSMSYPAVMKLLLAAGADPNQTNRYGENPLNLAIDYGSTDDVKALIDAGADVNHTDENGQTPLKRADSFNKVEMVGILMKHGATISGQVESVEVQSSSVASPMQITPDSASVVEESETAMNAESITDLPSALEPALAESEPVVAGDNSTTEVSAPLVEANAEDLQFALDQNPYLNRYQLGLTVMELVNGFATIELTLASDTLLQQAGDGIDLLRIDLLSLDLIQDRQAVTALRTALDYVTRKNNLEAILLLAPPTDSGNDVSIVETEVIDTIESGSTEVEMPPEEQLASEEERDARAAKDAKILAIAEERKTLIRKIQIELSNLGYDPGPADGVAGRGTRSAIKVYQNTAGLHGDGRPSDALLAHLQSSDAVQNEVSEPDVDVDKLEQVEMVEAEAQPDEADPEPDETGTAVQSDDQKDSKKKGGIKGFFNKLLNRE